MPIQVIAYDVGAVNIMDVSNQVNHGAIDFCGRCHLLALVEHELRLNRSMNKEASALRCNVVKGDDDVRTAHHRVQLDARGGSSAVKVSDLIFLYANTVAGLAEKQPTIGEIVVLE